MIIQKDLTSDIRLTHDNFINMHADLFMIKIRVSTANEYYCNVSQHDQAYYRSGTLNSNTVNSKFHLIQSFFEIFTRFLSFHV